MSVTGNTIAWSCSWIPVAVGVPPVNLDRDVAMLTAFTGLRWEEAVAVPVENVDLGGQWITSESSPSQASPCPPGGASSTAGQRNAR
jgi:hypothetical protein